jgi:hypothetical protein
VRIYVTNGNVDQGAYSNRMPRPNQNQNKNPNSRKKLQHQASQAHIAGLAVDKKKRLSCNQKAKQLANAFPTSYYSDSDQQHFAMFTSLLQCNMPEFHRVAYGLKRSPCQIGIKRTKLMHSDHVFLSPRPAVASRRGVRVREIWSIMLQRSTLRFRIHRHPHLSFGEIGGENNPISP